jgi:hypothetical protein
VILEVSAVLTTKNKRKALVPKKEEIEKIEKISA